MPQRSSIDVSRLAVGIDIGGTGTKAGLVDVATGTMLGGRVRDDTPQPATPEAVIATVASVVGTLGAEAAAAGLIRGADQVETLPIGCAFPGVIKHGTVQFTGNLDDAFDGFPIVDALSAALGPHVHMANDADAAGLAEMTCGAGREHRRDTVMMTTLGTGIGTALFAGGRLFPYTELGHLTVDGAAAETRTSVAAMRRDGYDMQEWCRRLTVYYRELERLFWPDLFIVGGGISKRAADFLADIDVKTPIRAAELLNNAGIVGAGLLGHDKGRMRVRRTDA
ncbi:polyphosphate--glucose phosphotransferase [Brevibacterium jeotgali]|uniref:Polyphosphate glucokinase n=1 Tax=Brevibacterium jeotgali TaxID=1262550 RepID=A0A2H1L8C1_9MICO|nr:ROK family protein [Brevibacterium jeotgali]TWC02738.1 polyphosphate glucokinase [Brevibacterium jeotgali]SMY13122.1 Polyphosphate glucokinase [Brevibacterium jeotgali]